MNIPASNFIFSMVCVASFFMKIGDLIIYVVFVYPANHFFYDRGMYAAFKVFEKQLYLSDYQIFIFIGIFGSKRDGSQRSNRINRVKRFTLIVGNKNYALDWSLQLLYVIYFLLHPYMLLFY